MSLTYFLLSCLDRRSLESVYSLVKFPEYSWVQEYIRVLEFRLKCTNSLSLWVQRHQKFCGSIWFLSLKKDHSKPLFHLPFLRPFSNILEYHQGGGVKGTLRFTPLTPLSPLMVFRYNRFGLSRN